MNTKNRESKKTRRAGFTLIEILLVVVIIGILASIGIPAIAGKSEKAKNAQAKSNIVMLSSGLLMYEMNNGEFPSSLEGLLDSSKEGFPFISNNTIPKDPWGNSFVYTTPGSRNAFSFDLSCTSKDGTPIANWEQ